MTRSAVNSTHVSFLISPLSFDDMNSQSREGCFSSETKEYRKIGELLSIREAVTEVLTEVLRENSYEGRLIQLPDNRTLRSGIARCGRLACSLFPQGRERCRWGRPS